MPPAPSRTPESLWLVRHAESEGNLADVRAREERAERLQLQARDPDMPLSRLGEQQADALGAALGALPADQRPTVVLCSPYERAYRTACRAVDAGRLGLEPVRDERLRERDLGVLDGYTGQGIRAAFPDEAARRDWVGKFYYRPPGGESWADVAGRFRAVLDLVERRYAGERVLVVSHQAVLMCARYVLEALTEQEILHIDRREQLANAGLLRYRYAPDGQPCLETVNDTTHLDRQDTPVTEEPDAATTPG